MTANGQRRQKLYVLHFMAEHVLFCLNIDYIKNVVPLVQVEAMPGSPASCAGMLNVAGKSILVFDLAMSLGLIKNQHYSIQTSIVLCESEKQTIGLIVDETIGLAEVEEQDMQMKAEFNQPNSPFLSIVPIDSKLSLLLNQNYLLALSTNQMIDKAYLSTINKVNHT